jgi:hypothetical protein
MTTFTIADGTSTARATTSASGETSARAARRSHPSDRDHESDTRPESGLERVEAFVGSQVEPCRHEDDDGEAERGEWCEPRDDTGRHRQHKAQGAEYLRDADEHDLCARQFGEAGPSLHAATDDLRSARREEEKREKNLDAPEDAIEFVYGLHDLLL